LISWWQGIGRDYTRFVSIAAPITISIGAGVFTACAAPNAITSTIVEIWQ
jgi:hypothetical protein